MHDALHDACHDAFHDVLNDALYDAQCTMHKDLQSYKIVLVQNDCYNSKISFAWDESGLGTLDLFVQLWFA